METSFDEEEGDEARENQDDSCERTRRQETRDFQCQCQMKAGIDFETSDVIDVDIVLCDDTKGTRDTGTDPAFDDNQQLLKSLEDKLRYIKLLQNKKIIPFVFIWVVKTDKLSSFSENQRQPWKQRGKGMLK